MKHEWFKLDDAKSDCKNLPIWTLTWEQCQFCRTVRRTYGHNGYWETEPYSSVQHSVGDGLIATEPPCLEKLTGELELRDEVKDLQRQMDNLARKVCLI